jgi:spore maturation protein CgeB
LQPFDLVLSFTGGRALAELTQRLGAKCVAPLYGHADPASHYPATFSGPAADLSYLGTYAADRQRALEELFTTPAQRHPERRVMLGGSGYPLNFPWAQNIWYRRHVAPPDHPAFFSASHLTLNVTRADMANMGYCPSGRLFEAAACGTLVVSDWWEGLDQFYVPGEEILIARSADDVSAALNLAPAERRRLAERAHARTLEDHSSAHRARELIGLLEGGLAHVGNHSSSGQWHANSAAGVL